MGCWVKRVLDVSAKVSYDFGLWILGLRVFGLT